MRFQFFAIPALDPQEAVAELNQFLGSHRVCSVTRELIADRRLTGPCAGMSSDDPAHCKQEMAAGV